MAKGGIIIQGVESVKAGIFRVMTGVRINMRKPLEDTGRKTKGVARAAASGQRDTGALMSSIKAKYTQEGPDTFIEVISAGDPKVIRGVGRFKTGKTTKNVTKKSPTTEYASVIDRGHGQGTAKGYMTSHGFGIAKLIAPKKVISMIRRVIKGFA